MTTEQSRAEVLKVLRKRAMLAACSFMNQIISVQPMPEPTGQLFYLDIVHGNPNRALCRTVDLSQ